MYFRTNSVLTLRCLDGLLSIPSFTLVKCESNFTVSGEAAEKPMSLASMRLMRHKAMTLKKLLLGCEFSNGNVLPPKRYFRCRFAHIVRGKCRSSSHHLAAKLYVISHVNAGRRLDVTPARLLKYACCCFHHHSCSCSFTCRIGAMDSITGAQAHISNVRTRNN